MLFCKAIVSNIVSNININININNIFAPVKRGNILVRPCVPWMNNENMLKLY